MLLWNVEELGVPSEPLISTQTLYKLWVGGGGGGGLTQNSISPVPKKDWALVLWGFD